MQSDEFNSFFKQHSENVDNSSSLGFWKLTDEILKTYLLENMPKRESVTVVDFGGGTGRWLRMLDGYFKDSDFIIVDLSKDMLAKANEKIVSDEYKNNIRLINSDITSITELADGSADYIISTYNPLSFVDEPQKVIDEAYRVLKKGGLAQITIQGYYNALYSKVNNFLADPSELNDIFTSKKVRWNQSVPGLWQLSKKNMEEMFKAGGFINIESRGIATIAQPQGEDFDPENKQIGPLSKKLNDNKDFFDTLLNIELSAGKDQDAVDRAMNILTIGTK
ncbi:MAG: class I SAM-dependent methyltransferase [Patescibacteria group bacterium]|jgi:ubiquinone/menaquinone biosynthesis C-methylase UbiE|nr:class I SAM-dependent methyltransferase [Patescibacteria group bacterium]